MSYCHNKGVFHMDIKFIIFLLPIKDLLKGDIQLEFHCSHVIICFHSHLQNVLVGSKRNMKISNFGHGVLPQHCKLHRHPHKT